MVMLSRRGFLSRRKLHATKKNKAYQLILTPGKSGNIPDEMKNKTMAEKGRKSDTNKSIVTLQQKIAEAKFGFHGSTFVHGARPSEILAMLFC